MPNARSEPCNEVKKHGMRSATRAPGMVSLRLSLVLLVACGACAGSLPSPEKTRHDIETFAPVPYPPPAALAETVPRRPESANVVWIDGEWVYQGRTYAWQRGGWVVPPTGARFAPWRALYQRDGRLMLAPGTWYDASGNAVPRPDIATPAKTPPNEATAESQVGR